MISRWTCIHTVAQRAGRGLRPVRTPQSTPHVLVPAAFRVRSSARALCCRIGASMLGCGLMGFGLVGLASLPWHGARGEEAAGPGSTSADSTVGCRTAAKALLPGAALAHAQDYEPAASAAGEQPKSASERATTFRAVKGPGTQQVPGGLLMIAAYIVLWLGVSLYGWRLVRRQDRVRRELDELSKRIKAA